jgi:2-keto-4-pentenoate hydratase
MLDEGGAYAIARAVHGRRVQRGEQPVGRKIGFTNPTTWAQYGVDSPIWGYMYDSTGSILVVLDRLDDPHLRSADQCRG